MRKNGKINQTTLCEMKIWKLKKKKTKKKPYKIDCRKRKMLTAEIKRTNEKSHSDCQCMLLYNHSICYVLIN